MMLDNPHSYFPVDLLCFFVPWLVSYKTRLSFLPLDLLVLVMSGWCSITRDLWKQWKGLKWEKGDKRGFIDWLKENERIYNKTEGRWREMKIIWNLWTWNTPIIIKHLEKSMDLKKLEKVLWGNYSNAMSSFKLLHISSLYSFGQQLNSTIAAGN